MLAHTKAAGSPFFLMYPEWAMLPVVTLATMATVIASQAVITGAFSLARQAVHLGFLPRLMIAFTSETNTGQIYVPAVNVLLFVGVVVLIFAFGDSESLATAYGISVTGAMVVTTLMSFQYLRSIWGWSALAATATLLPLLVLETVFLFANLLKIHDGGWVPVALALGIIIVMWTWTKGSRLLRAKTAHHEIPLETFIHSIEKLTHPLVIVPGTAVFLTSMGDKTPAVLLHNIKHNHVLHENNVILTVRTSRKPYVLDSRRAMFTPINERFARLELCFGFMEEPNVSKALAASRKAGLRFEIMKTSFYLSRRTLIGDPHSGLPRWQDELYIAVSHLGIDPSSYFKLPPNRVVEIGEQVTI